MVKNKDELYKTIESLLQKIPDYTPQKFKIYIEYKPYDMYPCIDICENEYHLDFYERGQLVSREVTAEESKVIYWVLEHSISTYAHQIIWNKYFDEKTNRLVYTDEIRCEERDIKYNSFSHIGGDYLKLYCQSRNSQWP